MIKPALSSRPPSMESTSFVASSSSICSNTLTVSRGVCGPAHARQFQRAAEPVDRMTAAAKVLCRMPDLSSPSNTHVCQECSRLDRCTALLQHQQGTSAQAQACLSQAMPAQRPYTAESPPRPEPCTGAGAPPHLERAGDLGLQGAAVRGQLRFQRPCSAQGGVEALELPAQLLHALVQLQDISLGLTLPA